MILDNYQAKVKKAVGFKTAVRLRPLNRDFVAMLRGLKICGARLRTFVLRRAGRLRRSF